MDICNKNRFYLFNITNKINKTDKIQQKTLIDIESYKKAINVATLFRIATALQTTVSELIKNVWK